MVWLHNSIKDIKKDELLALADELRAKTIEVVAKTGGHLGAGLGVVGDFDPGLSCIRDVVAKWRR